MTRRQCVQVTDGEGPCRAAPLRDGELCFFHDPSTAPEAEEARRLGRQRRKREATVAVAYDLQPIASADDALRLVDFAKIELAQLPNSVPRNRALIQAARVAVDALAAAGIEGRLGELERRLIPRRLPTRSALRNSPEDET
jgi:hypothetical protein